jgi:putative aldouronate transport system substrate-binding protein
LRRSFNKKWSAGLVVTFAASILATACSSSTPSVSDSSNTAPKHAKVLFTKGGFDAPPANDPIKAEIVKGSGVTFDQIAPPSANYAEQVSVILSSNDKPDAVKLPKFADLFDYQSQGALLALDDLLKDTPDIVKNIPKAALDQLRVDGKLYGIPIWTSEHRYNFIIRGDWLKKLNLSEPKTLDDLKNVYIAFRDKDPDGNGKKDTYGLAGIGFETFDPIFGAFGVMSPTTGFWYEENGKLLPTALAPNTKKALEYIKHLYAEGLIDPEWITTKNDAQLNEKGMKNQYGSTNHWWTWEPKLEEIMKKVDPNVEFRRIAPPIGPNGKSGVKGVNLVDTPIVILKNAKNPKAVMQLFNYLHTDQGMMTAYTGVEGVHWKKNADGTIVTTDQFTKDSKWIQWYALFQNEQPLLKVETPLVQSRRDSLKWPIITNAGDGIITEAQKKYAADLQLLIEDSFGKIITGKADISEFDKLAQQWKSKGGDQWTTEINKAYQAKKTAK